MARMTPAEATSVNIVIAFLAGQDEDPPHEVGTLPPHARERAYNRLRSGWHENAVAKQWPDAFTQPQT